MKTMTTTTARICLTTCVLLATAAIGCQSSEQRGFVRGDDFIGQGSERDLHRIATAQAAVGARLDATLHPMHFAGDSLNSLGRDKLDLMLKDTDACEVDTVYIDLPTYEASTFDPRHEAVVAYLKDRGLSDTQIKIEKGPNLHYAAPSAQGIRAMQAMDAGGTSPAGGASAASSLAPAASK